MTMPNNTDSDILYGTYIVLLYDILIQDILLHLLDFCDAQMYFLNLSITSC